jgi:NADH-quinone oxidoreductase subunit I
VSFENVRRKPVQVPRKQLTLWERLYLPEIMRGMSVTLRHLLRRKFTVQYPEQRLQLAPHFRGLPVLVRDEDERVKCVACQLCEFVCPPQAITITPRELPQENNVEKIPERFDLNVLRCIFCGFCEEVCPENAIFLSQRFEFAPTSREEMIFPMEKLLELGGVRPDPIKKWAQK